MKKILSLVLVLSLVLGTFSFAFAATPEDVVGEDSQEAVETLMALGVINGYPDGTYKPDKTLNRAEMAKLLVEALGYGGLSAGSTVSFADTQGHWAQDYIGFAASMDLVLGYPDGTFRPEATITMDEAMTMVIRSLGYTDDVLKGTWPTNYKVKALDLGLTDDLSTLSGPASRGNVAIMIFNALDARLVEVIKDNNGLFSSEYLENNDGSDKRLIDQIGTKVVDAFIDIDDVYGDDALDSVVDLEEYLFHIITYYENNDGDIAYVSDVDTEQVVGTLVGVDEDDKEITVDDGDDDVMFDVDNKVPFLYNGDKAKTTKILSLPDDETVEITVVHDDDDEVTGVIAWESKVRRIASEYTTRRPLKLDGANGFDLPEDDDELDMDALTVVGDADSLEDIMEDDVVHYYASDDTTKVKLLVVRDPFTGKFTERNTKGTEGVFRGESFDVSVYSSIDLRNGELGDTFDLFLDKNGDIFAWEVSEEDVDKDYAAFVALSADGTIAEDKFGKLSVDDEPAVQLFTEGGDVVTYNFDTSDLELDTLNSTVTLGDIELKVTSPGDGGDIKIIGRGDFDKKDLVEIELNDDGDITSIVIMVSDYDKFDEDDMLVDNYNVTEDTVIFNVSDEDEDDWTVIKRTALVGNIEGYFDVSSSTFNVLAMTVTKGLGDSDTYAAITDVVQYYNGKDTVYKITAFVDGEEGIYYTDKDLETSTDIEGTIKVFAFDGDEVNSITTPPDQEPIKVKSIDSLRVSGYEHDGSEYEDTAKLWAFADASAIYILDEDGDFLVGDAADILENDEVTLFLVEDDDDGKINDVKVLLLDLQEEETVTPTPTDLELKYTSGSAIQVEGMDADEDYTVRIKSSDAGLTLGDLAVVKESGDATKGEANLDLANDGDGLTNNKVYTAELYNIKDLDTMLDKLNFIFKEIL